MYIPAYPLYTIPAKAQRCKTKLNIIVLSCYINIIFPMRLMLILMYFLTHSVAVLVWYVDCRDVEYHLDSYCKTITQRSTSYMYTF